MTKFLPLIMAIAMFVALCFKNSHGLSFQSYNESVNSLCRMFYDLNNIFLSSKYPNYNISRSWEYYGPLNAILGHAWSGLSDSEVSLFVYNISMLLIAGAYLYYLLCRVVGHHPAVFGTAYFLLCMPIASIPLGFRPYPAVIAASFQFAFAFICLLDRNIVAKSRYAWFAVSTAILLYTSPQSVSYVSISIIFYVVFFVATYSSSKIKARRELFLFAISILAACIMYIPGMEFNLILARSMPSMLAAMGPGSGNVLGNVLHPLYISHSYATTVLHPAIIGVVYILGFTVAIRMSFLSSIYIIYYGISPALLLILLAPVYADGHLTHYPTLMLLPTLAVAGFVAAILSLTRPLAKSIQKRYSLSGGLIFRLWIILLALCLLFIWPHNLRYNDVVGKGTVLSNLTQFLGPEDCFLVSDDIIGFVLSRNGIPDPASSTPSDCYYRGYTVDRVNYEMYGKNQNPPIKRIQSWNCGYTTEGPTDLFLYGFGVLRGKIPDLKHSDRTYVYEERYTDFKMLVDATEVDNLMPNIQSGYLRLANFARPGRVTYTFSPEQLLNASSSSLKVDLRLPKSPVSMGFNPFIDTRASITVDVASGDNDFVNVAVFNYATLFNEPILRLRYVPEEVSKHSVVINISNFLTRSAPLRLRFTVFPGTSNSHLIEMTAWQFLLDSTEQIVANDFVEADFLTMISSIKPPFQLTRWSSPQRLPSKVTVDASNNFLPLSHDIYAFRLNKSNVVWPDSVDGVAEHDHFISYHADDPIQIVSNTNGDAQFLFYDIGLDKRFPFDCDPLGQIIDLPPLAGPVPVNSFHFRGVINRPIINIGDVALNIPVAMPMGGDLIVNHDGSGRISARPEIHQGPFPSSEFEYSRNVVYSSTEPCFRPGNGDDSAELVYKVSSEWPIARFRFKVPLRLHADIDRLNSVDVEYSCDGNTYYRLDSLASDGSTKWIVNSSWENDWTASWITPEAPTKDVYLRFRFSGNNTQVWASAHHRIKIDADIIIPTDFSIKLDSQRTSCKINTNASINKFRYLLSPNSIAIDN